MTTATFCAGLITLIAAFLWIIYFATIIKRNVVTDRADYESSLNKTRDAKLTLPFAIGLTLVAAVCWLIAIL